MVEKTSEKETRKNESKENSVEQNISDSYIPKSKLGDLPMTNTGLDKEAQKAMEKTKNDLDKFKKEITKEYKFIEEIGIVPAQANLKIEEEFEVPLEDCKKKLMHILVVVPEENFKEIQKIRLECIKKAKDIDDKWWVHVLTPVDIWNLGLDSKFDILEALAMSYPILDKGLFGALRLASIHKSLTLKKFEKYITSYIVAGSLVRGEAKPTSDVDVFIVIDDTDVKRMPRFELKEKLRSVIFQFIQEATAIAGAKNPLNVQVYLLTEFWEAVKDAHPVMFTFIRDGVPLYGRGTFLPWKSLLRMGKIKPSPEAVDMFMSSGDKLEESINRRVLDVAVMDIYWGILTPSQGILMMFGLAPPTPKETFRLLREVFVEKEKLLEEKYAKILEEIVMYYKDYEAGKHTKMTGTELDKMAKNALDYIKRLKQLREQIEKRVQDRSIQQTCKDVFGMLESILGKKDEPALIKAFDDQLVKHGKMPKRFLENIKAILKTRDEFKALDKDKKKKITIKEITAIEQARKMAAEITNTLIEFAQRKDFIVLDRKRFILKSKDKTAEVFFLTNLFIVEEGKIWAIKSDKLVESNVEELNKELNDSKEDKVKVTPKQMEIIKQQFGEFELSY
jgi:predicted nucleotidyltransferase